MFRKGELRFGVAPAIIKKFLSTKEPLIEGLISGLLKKGGGDDY